jgi:RNA polymerase sigma-70 factor (ECF subfamily)
MVMGRREKSSAIPSDDRIIDMYWERNPDAIQETDHKYGAMLRNVAYNILFDPLDCEECQNDAYLQIWNSIPATRPNAFSAFIVRIVRCIAISRYKEKSRKKRIPSQLMVSLEELEAAVSSGNSVEEIYEAKEIGQAINSYIDTLNERQRYLFMDRYFLAESVEKTAGLAILRVGYVGTNNIEVAPDGTIAATQPDKYADITLKETETGYNLISVMAVTVGEHQ